MVERFFVNIIIHDETVANVVYFFSGAIKSHPLIEGDGIPVVLVDIQVNGFFSVFAGL